MAVAKDSALPAARKKPKTETAGLGVPKNLDAIGRPEPG
jgi:hypothetical protein